MQLNPWSKKSGQGSDNRVKSKNGNNKNCNQEEEDFDDYYREEVSGRQVTNWGGSSNIYSHDNYS